MKNNYCNYYVTSLSTLIARSPACTCRSLPLHCLVNHDDQKNNYCYDNCYNHTWYPNKIPFRLARVFITGVHISCSPTNWHGCICSAINGSCPFSRQWWYSCGYSTASCCAFISWCKCGLFLAFLICISFLTLLVLRHSKILAFLKMDTFCNIIAAKVAILTFISERPQEMSRRAGTTLAVLKWSALLQHCLWSTVIAWLAVGWVITVRVRRSWPRMTCNLWKYHLALWNHTEWEGPVQVGILGIFCKFLWHLGYLGQLLWSVLIVDRLSFHLQLLPNRTELWCPYKLAGFVPEKHWNHRVNVLILYSRDPFHYFGFDEGRFNIMWWNCEEAVKEITCEKWKLKISALDSARITVLVSVAFRFPLPLLRAQTFMMNASVFLLNITPL